MCAHRRRAFRLERSPGGTCTHWKAPPWHGAHVKLTYQTATRDLIWTRKRTFMHLISAPRILLTSLTSIRRAKILQTVRKLRDLGH
jgi:hypothetical protein